MDFKSHYQNILLADDDTDDCALFADVLQELSKEVQFNCVESGDQLLQMLNGNNSKLPDVLFIDVNMPRKNGIECLREIKGNTRLMHIPVIVLSTSAVQWAVDAAYELKASLYVKKPDTFTKLKNVLQRVLAADLGIDGKSPKQGFLIDT
jgi:CheY-like chemotaxis protein